MGLKIYQTNLCLLLVLLFISMVMVTPALSAPQEGFTLIVSPEPGYIRFAQPSTGNPPSNELVVKNGWCFGALVHGIHHRFIFEFYPFYGKIKDIKTIGTISYFDVYPYINGNFSINTGFGLVTIINYTDTVDTNIISPFPLVGIKYKFGKFGSYINPWVGFMFDVINIDFKTPMPPDQKERDESILIGARFGYTPLPFISTVFKFYYKRCFDEVEKKNTVDLVNRTNIYFTRKIAVSTYIDFRQLNDGSNLLMFVAGPAFAF
ncbi:MAG: hypothetical protein ACUVWP_06565 [bacterium]